VKAGAELQLQARLLQAQQAELERREVRGCWCAWGAHSWHRDCTLTRHGPHVRGLPVHLDDHSHLLMVAQPLSSAMQDLLSCDHRPG
jgi:hypothetical protein